MFEEEDIYKLHVVMTLCGVRAEFLLNSNHQHRLRTYPSLQPQQRTRNDYRTYTSFIQSPKHRLLYIQSHPTIFLHTSISHVVNGPNNGKLCENIFFKVESIYFNVGRDRSWDRAIR